MPRRIDIGVCPSVAAHWNGGGNTGIIQVANGDLYLIFIGADSDVYYVKSTTNGQYWEPPVALFVGSATAVSACYDRDSGIAAGLIHVCYAESGTDDILYRTINTESSDALSTQTVVFAGASTATGGWLSITRARGGNVYVYGCIDAGAEGGFFRLQNANVPAGAWDAARANPEALATTDQPILVPGFAADSQDIMCIFVDASANQIDRYIYDDSANTWANTNIGSITDVVATTHQPHFACTVDLANSQIILIYWNVVDSTNADLLCWTITESAITAKTDVITDASDDRGFAAIGIDVDTGYWYAFFGGAADGSQVFPFVDLFYKVSTDGGTTWGPEAQVTASAQNIKWIGCTTRFSKNWFLAWYRDMTNDLIYVSVPIGNPCIAHQHAG